MARGFYFSIFLCYYFWNIQADNLIVETKLGTIRGKQLNTFRNKTLTAFLGIPFAQQPIGNLRFRRPRPPDPWIGTLNATRISPSCHQRLNSITKIFRVVKFFFPEPPFSDDCLYLNVFVPEPKPNNSAVMVYFYGGAFCTGSSNTPIYDPSTLVAEEGIIVVTFNYRVASLGFVYLDHPEFDANRGLLDQQMALRFIHENIEFFGGDPNKVTLFGQSAGGASVGFHLLAKSSWKYFSRVIIQSGPVNSEWSTQTKKENADLTLQIAENLECPNKQNMSELVRCLQEHESSEILGSEPTREWDEYLFRPIIDGDLIKADPAVSIKNNDFKATKVLLGVNRNDGTLLLLYNPLAFAFVTEDIDVNYEDLEVVVKQVLRSFPDIVYNSALFKYTNWNYNLTSSEIVEAGSRLLSDFYFNCGTMNLARQIASRGEDVFSYLFDHQGGIFAKWVGAGHGEEIPFVFGKFFEDKVSDENWRFSKRMMRYWANFAKTGNPNQSSSFHKRVLPHWPKFTTKYEETIVLAPKVERIIGQNRKKSCAFWDRMVPCLKALNNPKLQ